MEEPKGKNIELFRELAQGSEKAYDALYSIYARRLFGFIAGIVERDPVETEEVLANVMDALWAQRDRFGTVDDPEAWLYTIAKYQALDRKKLINRRRVQLEGLQARRVSELTTDGALEREELTAIIWTATERLTPSEKEVFLCTWLEGLTPAAIAKRLGLDARTVYNQLYTARKKVGEELEGYFNELNKGA